jgi:hypothetical protein
MKSKQQIKDELHKLIDSIEDEETLNVLNEDVVPYVIENKTMPSEDEEDELTQEQQTKPREKPFRLNSCNFLIPRLHNPHCTFQRQLHHRQ